mgnify:CR=1 FL=1
MKKHYEDDEMLGELFHFTGVKSFVFIYIGTEIEYDRKYYLMSDILHMLSQGVALLKAS